VNGTETVVEFVTEVFPIVGAAGTVVIVTEEDALEVNEVPLELVAVTVNVGVALVAIPVTVIGDDAPVAV